MPIYRNLEMRRDWAGPKDALHGQAERQDHFFWEHPLRVMLSLENRPIGSKSYESPYRLRCPCSVVLGTHCCFDQSTRARRLRTFLFFRVVSLFSYLGKTLRTSKESCPRGQSPGSLEEGTVCSVKR